MKPTIKIKAARPLLFVLLSLATSLSHSASEVNLIQKMASLQYFTHKATLAIDHKNPQLAQFYLQELDKVVGKLAEVNIDHGKPIGLLTKTTLLPTLQPLAQSIEEGDWEVSSAALDNMIRSCNECHMISEHDFISIVRRTDNPYTQSFNIPQ